jgi:hypothetical protein
MRGCVAAERFSDFVGLDSFKTITLLLQTFYSVEYGGMITNRSEAAGNGWFQYYFHAIA